MIAWPSFALILIGTFLTTAALFRARRFTGRLADPALRRPWRFLTLLMAIFVMGYLAALGLVAAGHWEWLASLTAIIFLAGAIYVLLSVSVAEEMASGLLDSSTRLERLIVERTAEAEAARREAEEASHAKSHYLAEMSHELRTPLNSVVGFANILRKNRQDSFDAKELLYLERILENGKHLLNLVNDILDLSKIEARRVELNSEDVALDRLLGEVLGQFSAQAREKEKVRLLLQLPTGGIAPLATDRGKLFQILVNLVGNALKFTAEGTVRVRVWVETESRRPARIEVIDSGIGIAPDKLETIFEPFRQADESIQRQFGGTGLGLNISRSLCELLGWRLSAASDGPGEGTTFTMTLLEEPAEPLDGPRRDSDSNEVMPLTDLQLERTMRHDLEGKSALVVDGGSGLVQEVQHFGMTAFTAADLEEAIESLERLDPDLVLVDTTAGADARRFFEHVQTRRNRGEIRQSLMAIGKNLPRGDTWAVLEPPITRLRLLGHLWKLVSTPERQDGSPAGR